jgi:molybdopterin/thiamine biosynthesis adenylyltransferase
VTSPGPRSACVLGVGGLGCPAVLGLVAAGVRHLHLVDHDVVEGHNLQRQVLYTQADVGRPKVEAAAHRVRARMPEVSVHAQRLRLRPEQVPAFVEALPADAVVLEGSDDPVLKFAVSDACVRAGRKVVIGAAVGWSAQVMAWAPGTACYRCVFEHPRENHVACDAAGILGAVVGLAGHLMAVLAIGLATRPTEVAGRMHVIDARTLAVRELHPRPRPDCPACGVPERAAGCPRS